MGVNGKYEELMRGIREMNVGGGGVGGKKGRALIQG